MGIQRVVVSYDELSDEQLVTLVTQWETQALGALYDRHSRAVYGFVLHMLRAEAEASRAKALDSSAR